MKRIKAYLTCSTFIFAGTLPTKAEEAMSKATNQTSESIEIDSIQDIAVESGIDADIEVDSVATSAPSLWPKKKILTGERKLLCIGVKYINVEKAVGQPGCQYAADRIAEFYRRNSNGRLKIIPTALPPFQTNMKGSSKVYDIVVGQIKKAYPGYNYYVIPGIYTHPHAGGKVAHVISAQFMTATHEVGHLLGLGHAGRYLKKDGKFELNAYGDTDSIMGRVISRFITAPQYYYLGWLPEQEVVLYDAKVASYDLKKIGEFGTKGLSTIVVPASVITQMSGITQVRPAYISATRCAPATCVAIHLQSGGGSQKVAEVTNEYYDSQFTGLHVKVLKQLTRGKIRISVDFAKKPNS